MFLLGLIESLLVAWELPFFRGSVGQGILDRALVWSAGIGITAALRGWGSARLLCYPLGHRGTLIALLLSLGLGGIRGGLACFLGSGTAGLWPTPSRTSGVELIVLLALGVVVECAAPPTWSRPQVFLLAFCLIQPAFQGGQPGAWSWLVALLGLGLFLCLLGGVRTWAPLAPRR